MSALQHIKDYLSAHFANHDIATLMTHFETAIEAKVEEAVAEVKAELHALRDELTGGRPAPQIEPEPEPQPEPAEPEPVVAIEPAAETGSAA